jgi:hypothetical protein
VLEQHDLVTVQCSYSCRLEAGGTATSDYNAARTRHERESADAPPALVSGRWIDRTAEIVTAEAAVAGDAGAVAMFGSLAGILD